ncbi:alcohol dehydrogenase catalytic domain-containing protein [Curvibacter sp. APW13]|uniref:alcohol dehydrogenase catalytic domain-containing protein n=1 Tax=Curvibacter sp. APW13 TaxID=3077236 RepID=UPI0028DF81DC|nr:alcohol dehydrogenase catalytic domain-containing protein [Curvibacter sp. APW13]MDT8989365.1 alcohol dehydrogenase catalytic domain-containing protein [Curvibacter sp. APW13]
MPYHGLFCTANAGGFALEWRPLGGLPRPSAHEVLVQVRAASVNPIDTKRAAGYGARLLRLKGATGMPRVLGNDFAGVVADVGSGVREFAVGQRVWGVLDTGAVGTHASHVVVPTNQLFFAPHSVPDAVLAALPYNFCTMWRALRDAGIEEHGAKGRRILVHGASGGLGLLALQILRGWGAITTAVCSTPAIEQCFAAGASEVYDRTSQTLHDLEAVYDAVLNFANWTDERVLATKLNARALGMASTTHPLLASLDQYGWLRGAWRIVRAQREVRQLVRQCSPTAVYRWTVFRPDAQALLALNGLLRTDTIDLPIGISCPVTDAQAAFVHVAQQKRGRAILTFNTH